MTASMSSGRLALMLVCGCLIAMIGLGLRSSFGLLNDPVSATHGWGRTVFGLALAIQNLFWGLGQPIAGALADRFGTWRVLLAGGVIYAAGIALIPSVESPLHLHLTAGVLVGLGTAFSSFPLVLAVFGRSLPARHKAKSFGLGTAAGSAGMFVFAHITHALVSHTLLATALWSLGAFALAIICLAPALREPVAAGAQPRQVSGTEIREAGVRAFKDGSFNLLFWGFFVCGFHVAFITVHLPPYLRDLQIETSLIAWSIGLIGLFNIVGSFGSGLLMQRWSKRLLLSGIYALRAVVITLFLVFPVTEASVVVFSCLMGLLWLSTVPPTTGLVDVRFGTRTLATLFGLVFLGHQLGAFCGAWLGGAMYERYGSYDGVWWMAVGLSIFAALVHLPIREQPHPALVPAT